MVQFNHKWSSLHITCWSLVLFAMTFPAVLWAAPGATFPYKAEVTADRVEVYSGPGSRFYATGELTKSNQVTVHRHDPGGWYMISPPRGSVSLVRADYVQKETQQLGIIKQNHVVVRVASTLNKHREVEQRRLMKGDRVHILGEDKVDDRGRVLTMYRIAPPRGEFRWVKGEYLLPLDPYRRKQHNLDPFAIPTNATLIETHPAHHSKPVLKQASNETKKDRTVLLPADQKKTASTSDIPLGKSTGVIVNRPSQQKIDQDRNILQALDRNFRDMIQKDISVWKLDDLIHDYKKLKTSTGLPALATQVDLRLQAMQRYKKMKAEYDDFIQLTSATDQKDTQLLNLQNETQKQLSFPQTEFPEMFPSDDSGEPFGFPVENSQDFLPDLGPSPFETFPEATENDLSFLPPEANGNPFPSPQFLPGNHPFSDEPPIHQQSATAPAGNPVLPPKPVMPTGPQQANQFSGAGIVQQIIQPNPTGGNQSLPQYYLASPDGNFLTFLQTTKGVNLNPYVGKAIGVYGPRTRQQNLQGDVINVTGFSPVKLSK